MVIYTVTPKPETHKRILADLRTILKEKSLESLNRSLEYYGLAKWTKADAYADYVLRMCDALESAITDGQDYAEIEIGSFYTASGHPQFLGLSQNDCDVVEEADHAEI